MPFAMIVRLFPVRLFAFLVAVCLSCQAALALPALAPGDDAPAGTAEEGAIEAPPEAGADAAIQTRIRAIFAELPEMRNVRASVEAGVVSLSGEAGDAEAIARAESIASRIEGVATVDNAIERSASVDDGIGVLDELAEKVRRWSAMLPLVALAIGVGLAIAFFGYLVAGLGSLWHRIAPNGFLAELIASAIRFVFVVIGIVVALDILGAGALLGAVLGGAGVVGIALGFAMRDTIENYVASLMLSLRQPFRANDHVVIADQEGRVIRLTSRATVLMTLDGNHLRIPNGEVFRATILNYTRNPQRRFEFELGVDADDDPDAARRVGREAMGELPFVLDNPGPEARTIAVGDSNIVILFLGWIDQREADWHRARSRAIAAVKTALEEAGFGLPEPIYRLRFDPRSDPLPFQNIDSSPTPSAAPSSSSSPQPPPAPAVAPAPTRKPVSGTREDEDVAPRDEIAEMVENERSQSSDEKDLLDSQRPIE